MRLLWGPSAADLAPQDLSRMSQKALGQVQANPLREATVADPLRDAQLFSLGIFTGGA